MQRISAEVERMRSLLAAKTGVVVPLASGDPQQSPVDSNDDKASSASLDENAAFERVVALVNVRERSSVELRRRLVSEGSTPENVDRAVERAVRCGLVDDARFADVYVRSKIRAGWGRRKIEHELEGYGVDPHAALPAYPDEYFAPDSEYERACGLLGRKALPAKNPFEKLARHLVNKGFSNETAFRAARWRIAQNDADV